MRACVTFVVAPSTNYDCDDQVHRELPHGFFMLQQFLPTAKPAIEGIFQRMLQSLEE